MHTKRILKTKDFKRQTGYTRATIAIWARDPNFFREERVPGYQHLAVFETPDVLDFFKYARLAKRAAKARRRKKQKRRKRLRLKGDRWDRPAESYLTGVSAFLKWCYRAKSGLAKMPSLDHLRNNLTPAIAAMCELCQYELSPKEARPIAPPETDPYQKASRAWKMGQGSKDYSE